MTPIEALQAVYAKGEHCRECDYCCTGYEIERLADRTIGYTTFWCAVIESQESKLPREAWDCPGVEDELGKKPCESE